MIVFYDILPKENDEVRLATMEEIDILIDVLEKKCFYCYRTQYIGGNFVCLALRKKLTQNEKGKIELKQGKCPLKEV